MKSSSYFSAQLLDLDLTSVFSIESEDRERSKESDSLFWKVSITNMFKINKGLCTIYLVFKVLLIWLAALSSLVYGYLCFLQYSYQDNLYNLLKISANFIHAYLDSWS